MRTTWKVIISLLASFIILTVITTLNPNHCFSSFVSKYFSNWAAVYSVIAALILLYLIHYESTKDISIRKEDRKIETERRNLDSIIEWLNQVNGFLMHMDTNYLMTKLDIKIQLRNLEEKGEWVIELSSLFHGEINNKMHILLDSITKYKQDFPNVQSDTKKHITDSLSNTYKAIIEIKKKESL